jgi:hypothetical protein
MLFNPGNRERKSGEIRFLLEAQIQEVSIYCPLVAGSFELPVMSLGAKVCWRCPRSPDASRQSHVRDGHSEYDQAYR